MSELSDEAVLPSGVTAVYLYEDRVVANASDFRTDCPGGFTLQEAQEHRARRLLAIEVVHALSSRALYENLDANDCEQILRKMKGKVHIIYHSHHPAKAQSCMAR